MFPILCNLIARTMIDIPFLLCRDPAWWQTGKREDTETNYRPGALVIVLGFPGKALPSAGGSAVRWARLGYARCKTVRSGEEIELSSKKFGKFRGNTWRANTYPICWATHSSNTADNTKKTSQKFTKQQKQKAEVQFKHWLISWAKQRRTMSGEGDMPLQG